LDLGYDAKLWRGIIGGNGVTIHGRPVTGGKILPGAHILSQDTAKSFGQRHGHGPQRQNLVGNQSPGSGHGNH
jgi:hypothetical protein